MLDSGVIPHLADAALPSLETELHHHIDQAMQQTQDIGAREVAPGGALLDQQDQLLEGELGAGSVQLVMEPGWPELTLRR